MNTFITKHWWKFLLALIIIAAVSINLYQTFQPENVLAYQLQREKVLVTLTVTGEVQADNTVTIAAPFQARIDTIHVDEGDAIQTGQPLVTLDKDDIQSSYQQARAAEAQALAAYQFIQQGTRPEELTSLKKRQLEAEKNVLAAKADAENAKRYAERLKPLHAEGAVSDNEFDSATTKALDADARYAAAQQRLADTKAQLQKGLEGPTRPERAEAYAAYQAAQANRQHVAARLNDYTLTSPLNGLVLIRIQEPGDITSATQPILKIADRETLEVTGFVEEADLSRVALKDTCYVLLDASPETPIKGSITEIGHEVNPENGTVPIKVQLPPHELQTHHIHLLPGMTADINIITDTLTNALVVPATAVLKDKNSFSVFVFNNNRIEKRTITAKRVSLDYFQILDGLSDKAVIARTASLDLLKKGAVSPTVPPEVPSTKETP